jgi:transcription initiation factor TFIID subunit 2
VSVASYPAEFVHYDAVSNLNMSNSQDCHTFPELKRKLYAALSDGDEGELSIAIPKEVPIRLLGNTSVGPIFSESTCRFCARFG